MTLSLSQPLNNLLGFDHDVRLFELEDRLILLQGVLFQPLIWSVQMLLPSQVNYQQLLTNHDSLMHFIQRMINSRHRISRSQYLLVTAQSTIKAGLQVCLMVMTRIYTYKFYGPKPEHVMVLFLNRMVLPFFGIDEKFVKYVYPVDTSSRWLSAWTSSSYVLCSSLFVSLCGYLVNLSTTVFSVNRYSIIEIIENLMAPPLLLIVKNAVFSAIGVGFLNFLSPRITEKYSTVEVVGKLIVSFVVNIVK